MAPFEEIEHTADWALRVWAPTLPGLFADAAAGMFRLLGCEGGRGARSVTRQVRLEADDLETLLVDWLGELLYLSQTYRECYDHFEIERLEAPHLRARVRGETGAAPGKDIKAVTYADLHITSGAQGFETRVTFDV